VQTRLVRAWPPWATRFGVPIGWAIVVTSGLFALGHYVGEWGNPARLGPFFPALLFSAMRARSGSIPPRSGAAISSPRFRTRRRWR